MPLVYTLHALRCLLGFPFFLMKASFTYQKNIFLTFLFALVSRSGKLVLWDVSLNIIPMVSLMLHLVYLNQLEQLVSSDQWNQLSTIQRTTLIRHDGE